MCADLLLLLLLFSHSSSAVKPSPSSELKIFYAQFIYKLNLYLSKRQNKEWKDKLAASIICKSRSIWSTYIYWTHDLLSALSTTKISMTPPIPSPMHIWSKIIWCKLQKFRFGGAWVNFSCGSCNQQPILTSLALFDTSTCAP